MLRVEASGFTVYRGLREVSSHKPYTNTVQLVCTSSPFNVCALRGSFSP